MMTALGEMTDAAIYGYFIGIVKAELEAAMLCHLTGTEALRHLLLHLKQSQLAARAAGDIEDDDGNQTV